MKAVPASLVIVVAVLALVLGGTIGFLLGVGATKAGASFLEGMVASEREADVRAPRRLERERFELLYPQNWTVDVEDEDYDPDQLFSIDSPGNSFVSFFLVDEPMSPGELLEARVEGYTRLMGEPETGSFDSLGRLTGEGRVLRGRIFTIPVTVKVFECSFEGLTAVVTQQYPDEDRALVEAGFSLIEGSFVLKPAPASEAPEAGDGK